MGVRRFRSCPLRATALLGCTVVVSFALGCTNGASEPVPGADNTVAMGSVRIVILLPESLQGSNAAARLVPNATRLVRATITGAGIASAIAGEVSLPVGHGNTATINMDVPSGSDRTLLVEAFDDSPAMLAQASTMVDIQPGVNLPIGVELQPEAWIMPTASALASPTSVAANDTVTFSGTGTDADGGVILYEWDFETDGAWDYSSATTAATSHSYSAQGAYTATLRVTDDDRLTSTDTAQITVN